MKFFLFVPGHDAKTIYFVAGDSLSANKRFLLDGNAVPCKLLIYIFLQIHTFLLFLSDK
jgi:hypothetical protein